MPTLRARAHRDGYGDIVYAPNPAKKLRNKVAMETNVVIRRHVTRKRAWNHGPDRGTLRLCNNC